MTIIKTLIAGAALSAGLLAITPVSAATVIVNAVYNAADPGGAFTPSDPFGTILNTPLYETVGGKGNLCTKKSSCTYDFTFTLSGIIPGSTTQLQLQAAVQHLGVSTPEILNYDLFSGTPGSATFTPISSPTFIAASTPVNTVGQVVTAMLTDGTYYVQIMPSQVKVSGEVASGSLTEFSAVPELMAWTLMLVGIGGVGLAVRSRRPRGSAA